MNKKLQVSLLGIALFYVITIFFFQSEVLQNKTLQQSDVIQFEGMSKWSVDYRNKTGEEALWNEGMFSGMPDFMVATGTSTWGVNTVHHFMTSLLLDNESASLFILSAVCFLILLLAFDIHPLLAVFGALVYAFNTYNMLNIEAGHVTKTWAIAYASLVLAGFRHVFKGNWWIGVPLTVLGLTLELRADHIQITYYLVFACAIYTLSEVVWRVMKKEINTVMKIALMLAGICLVAGGTVVCKLWISKEYSNYSIRGERLLTPEPGTESANPKEGLDKGYAFSWSQGKAESFTLLVPYFYGGASNEKLQKGTSMYDFCEKNFGEQRTEDWVKKGGFPVSLYRGEQPFTGGPLYAGAITCFLFVLGLLVVESRHKYWMAAAALLALMFAWGRHLEWFNYLMFDYFPMFNKFRSVSMALSLTLLLMPLLGFIGLNKLLHEGLGDESQKKLFLAAGIVAGLCLCIWGYSLGADFSMPNDTLTANRIFQGNEKVASEYVYALEADRGGFLRADALRSLILVLLAAGVVWLGLKQKLQTTWAIVIIGVLAFGELWSVDKRYLNDSKFERRKAKQAHQKTPADELILRDKDPHYRVYNHANGGGNTFKEAFTSYYHKSIGGYHAAKLRRYQDLIEKGIFPEQQKLVTILNSGSQDLSSLNVLNMLNAKYLKLGNEARQVVPNRSALGNAWFVNDLVDVANADEEMAKLGTINTATTAVVNFKEFKIDEALASTDSLAKIELTAYSPKKLTYKSSSQKNGVAVFSEIYYPEGWVAKIDGEEASIVRANYVLRALRIPAGEHTITFEFNSESYEKGYTIATISGYLFVLIVFGGFGLAIFKKMKGDDSDAASKTPAKPVERKVDEQTSEKQDASRKPSTKRKGKRKKR